MCKLIGNTPMVKINYDINNKKHSVYAKLEWYSLTGSVKDRIVEYIFFQSKSLGILKDGQTIVETTSGNTGIAIAALGAYYNHDVIIYMPDDVSKERIEIIKLYGADVILVSKEDGGFIKCLELSSKYCKENDAFLFNQFSNQLNVLAHYNTTAVEISKSLDYVDIFVSGIGSGGTAIGVKNKLKEFNDDVKLFVVEPEESQVLSGKGIGKHNIQGIGDDFVPDIVDTNKIDKIIPIKSDDAILMSKKLAKELGLGVGISSGANMLASIISNSDDKTVVTIFSDDLKKYLSTDLVSDITENDFINSINFINYEVIN